ELWYVRHDNAAVMSKAGVKIAIMNDTGSETMWLPRNVAVAVKYGLDEDDAMKTITINAAEIIGIADRVGSLEAGKDADVVVWSGHPLHAYTWADTVIINGKVEYDRRK
ncbi:MAG: amidohydrolase family protein, partial [Bacillota bacterium]